MVTSLQHFSLPSLNLLASLFADEQARVVLSERTRHPATVALESRTIVLDPNRAGLYDLAVCSRLLPHRRLRLEGPDDLERRDHWLTLKARHRLIPIVWEELRKRYPGISKLPGQLRPGSALKGLRVVVRSVEWEPLTELHFSPNTHGAIRQGGNGAMEFFSIPELELTGADDDLAWLLEAIEQGRFPLESLSGLEELPYLAVPFRPIIGDSCPLQEQFESLATDPENRSIIAGLVSCYRRKSEVRQELGDRGRHTRRGIRLDPNRLAEALVDLRSGIEPRIFRRLASSVEPVFDPGEHLAVISFDANDLSRQADWHDADRRLATQRFLVCMINAFRELEIDFIVQGSADRLLTLSNGNSVCLHLTVRLKAINDELGGAFWNRMGCLLSGRLQLPGQSACFHPLSLRDVAAALEEADRESEYSYRSINWWARRLMPKPSPLFQRTGFLRQVAANVDTQMEELQRRFYGTLDTQASFLPAQLKEHGVPGRYLSSVDFT